MGFESCHRISSVFTRIFLCPRGLSELVGSSRTEEYLGREHGLEGTVLVREKQNTEHRDENAAHHDCSASTTFLRSAFGLLSPARECFRLRSSLTACASSIVRLSCVAFLTALGIIRDLSPHVTSALLCTSNDHVPLDPRNLLVKLPPLFKCLPVLERVPLPPVEHP